jgi:hypothetical protein
MYFYLLLTPKHGCMLRSQPFSHSLYARALYAAKRYYALSSSARELLFIGCKGGQAVLKYLSCLGYYYFFSYLYLTRTSWLIFPWPCTGPRKTWPTRPCRHGSAPSYIASLHAEIQFGSRVRMLPLPKKHISKCQKIWIKNSTCTSP